MQKALRDVASETDAVFLQRFFKTGEGQYGAGDKFLGVRVPATRKIVKEFRDAPLEDILALLKSEWHEERLLALQLMVHQYETGNIKHRKKLYDAYLANAKYVNNWDLVDTSAREIVGAQLFDANAGTKALDKLAKSKDLWERRIAIIATSYFIAREEYAPTLRISKILRLDDHDLVHKAVGWMLREVGNRNRGVEERFLVEHQRIMPRTMLRYAIEKFPEALRKQYLNGTAKAPKN